MVQPYQPPVAQASVRDEEVSTAGRREVLTSPPARPVTPPAPRPSALPPPPPLSPAQSLIPVVIHHHPPAQPETRTFVREPIVIVEPVTPAPRPGAAPGPGPDLDDNPRPTRPIPCVVEPVKTIPPDAPKQFPAPNNAERVPKSAETIPESAQNAPEPEEPTALNMPEVEDEGEVGRKRKYEGTGIYGDISIKDVVLFRHIRQRHFPDLSADMREWYEHFYFAAPVVGESAYRGKDYEQHKRAYERGQRWIAAYEASLASAETMGDRGSAIIPFQKRANG